MKKKNCMKFSLIELLIAIAVIAILVSALLPALQKAKQTAIRIHCASNLKQFGTAEVLYAGSSNDYLVPLVTNRDITHNDVRWCYNPLFVQMLDRKNRVRSGVGTFPKSLYCRRKAFDTYIGFFYAKNIHYPGVYVDDKFIEKTANLNSMYCKQQTVRRPSMKINITDGVSTFIRYNDPKYAFPADKNRGYFIAYGHGSSRANTLLYDGHVESWRPGNFWDGSWQQKPGKKIYDRWQLWQK